MDAKYFKMINEINYRVGSYVRGYGLTYTTYIDDRTMTIIVSNDDTREFRKCVVNFNEVEDLDLAVDMLRNFYKHEFGLDKRDLNSIYGYKYDVASLYPSFMPAKSNIDPVDSMLYTHKLLQSRKTNNSMEIKNVIFNDPATIVFWKDGTKTVVKCQDGEPYDPEKGLAMAIAKKTLGNTREYYNTILHWLKKVPVVKEPETSIYSGIRAADPDISCINCTHILEPVDTEICGSCANDPAHPNFKSKGE